MKKSLGSLFMGDRVIWIIFFLLCAISIVEVFSAVSTLTYKSGSYWAPLRQHVTFLFGGAVACWVFHRIECRFFRVFPIFLLPVSILLLVFTTFTSAEVNEAARWFSIGFVRFQPSELAKCAVVMTSALILSQLQTENGADKRAFKYIMWMTVPICFLIFTENLSTAAILFLVVVLMMFIGRVPLVQLGKLFGVIFISAALFGGIIYALAKNDTDHKLAEIPLAGKVFHRAETWIGRIEARTNEDSDDPAKFDLNDKTAQVAHANIAIANSNIIGRMPGNSVERDFLSQAYCDFIYAIIIEETGIWGAALVLMLYIFLLFRVGRLASRCEHTFAPFLAMGLALLITTQALVNMCVAVGLAPVTGQPLPLISRGGTSAIINGIYIGMILSVSRYAQQTAHPEPTSFDGPLRGVKREEKEMKKLKNVPAQENA